MVWVTKWDDISRLPLIYAFLKETKRPEADAELVDDYIREVIEDDWNNFIRIDEVTPLVLLAYMMSNQLPADFDYYMTEVANWLSDEMTNVLEITLLGVTVTHTLKIWKSAHLQHFFKHNKIFVLRRAQSLRLKIKRSRLVKDL